MALPTFTSATAACLRLLCYSRSKRPSLAVLFCHAIVARMRGGAVSDRCCLDFLVLWLYHGLGDDDLRTAGLAHRAFRDLAEYGAVVVMPWGILPSVDDDAPAANPWPQLHFDALFEGMARDHIEGRRLLRLPRDILDATARVDWIHARVSGDS